MTRLTAHWLADCVGCRYGFYAVLAAVFCSVKLTAAEEICPVPLWTQAEPQDVRLNNEQLIKVRDYALTGGGSGYITRGGKLVMSWGDLKKRYDLKSSTKSFGSTALGLAILDGKVALSDKGRQHHPGFGVPPARNADTRWIDSITIQHLATQTAGFEKPGGYEKLIFEPGTKWADSDGGPNWLAECVTLVCQQDVDKLMFDRVFTPIGIKREDLVWRNNSYRPKELDGIPWREFGSGISANVDAMARFGLLYLRGGEWNGLRILPADFVRQSGATVPAVVGLPEVDLTTAVLGATSSANLLPPYPPSPVISGIEWAPVSSIVRKARGGDNWPMTTISVLSQCQGCRSWRIVEHFHQMDQRRWSDGASGLFRR